MKKFFIQLSWIAQHAKPISWLILINITISICLSMLGVYGALLSKSLIDAATSLDLSLVFKWLGIMAAVLICRILLHSLYSVTSTIASTTLKNKMQYHLFDHITYSKWLSHSQYHSVNLLTRITSDVSVIVGLINGTLSSLISLSVTLVTSFVTLLFLEPTVALISIIISPCFILGGLLFGKKMRNFYIEQQDHSVAYNSFIQESIQNLMIIKTFCTEKRSLHSLKSLQAKSLRLNLRSTYVGIVANLFLTISSYLTYFIVFGFCAIKLTQGLISFGTLTALLQLYNNVQGPLSALSSIAPNMIKSLASAERLMEIENLPLEAPAFPKLNLKNCVAPHIHFNNISFGYKENICILDQVSCTIKPGEIIGLIGPSGGGKTTLIRLLLGLIEPQNGSLTLVDSYVPHEINPIHRELISYVPQGNTLFSGTIKENLCYGNSNATDGEINHATSLACARDFIEKLEAGLETKVGERGLGISEGQAQRLSIARAFLREKPILILDEATSALDPPTEFKILHAVKTLHHHPTCLIITHRPSALSICDRVFQLENQTLRLVDLQKNLVDSAMA